ncbi:hypothetical protein [Virgibacillus ndiopensis]|uniref:hypothetical protein n=1 Tax=Virgibacillus ndiopensis TaxID=2004408 RepID=UPI000C07F683|nr:hypothetical protein [Virgibacillus ndiopensis]
MMKLNENEIRLLRTIIEENNSIIELDNKHYYLSAIEIHEPNTQNKTTSKLEEKKRNLLNEGKFSIDDVVEMIDQGVL